MNIARDFNSILQQHQAGQLQEALSAYLALLESSPNHVDALVSLATLYLQLGKLDESAQYFEKALALQPSKLLALHNYGLCLKQLKLFDRALAQFDLAISVNPQYELAYKNKFALLASMGRHEERILGLRQALFHLPGSLELTLLLVASLRALKQHDEALTYIENLLRIKPDSEIAYNLRGNILLDLDRAQEAVFSYQQAIQLQHNYAKAHGNLGIAYLSLAKYNDALTSFDRALELDPNLVGMPNNRANALQNLHRFDEAIAAYDEILIPAPHDFVAAANKGMLCLLLGRFAEGWPLYEARWHNTAMSIHKELSAYPVWDGTESLNGKTIILHPEQGYGDTIQFSRYARVLAKSAEKVYLVVNQPLFRLMQTSVLQWPECEQIEVISAGDQVPAFHYQLPLLSAPCVLKTDLNNIPNFGTYLYCDDESRAKWSQILGPRLRPRIGIVWSGSDKHSNDKNRSLSLAELASVLSAELACDVEFHSLQKEIKSADLSTMAMLSMSDHAENLQNFSDTSALIMHMDLVVSVDTSVAHLAAGLGMPTWVLLPHVPDFRWLLERSDSPWYDSVRLFRQTQARDWSPVLQEVVRACNAQFQMHAVVGKENLLGRINYANELISSGRWQEAEAIFRQEFDAQRVSAKLYNNWGVVLQKLRRFDEALAAFDASMQMDSDYVSPRLNKSVCLLSLGRFDEGWRLYEWRWKNAQWDSSRRNLGQPLWLGQESLAGKKILVYAEQGLGDSIQFCRLLRNLLDLKAVVSLEVPRALLALFRCLPVAVYENGTAPQDYDYQCPLLSLPLALKLGMDNIPHEVPYLRIEQELQTTWLEKVCAYQTPLQARKKIGVVWAGSSRHNNDAQRSLPFSMLAKVLQHDADFFILQKDIKPADRVGLRLMQSFGKRIFIMENELHDLIDTAALINCLDLIVSVDTSVAHLAGALAKPLCVLLPYEADFRWLQDRSDSPWYPSASLYRQQDVGDWSSPLNLVNARIHRLISADVSQEN